MQVKCGVAAKRDEEEYERNRAREEKFIQIVQHAEMALSPIAKNCGGGRRGGRDRDGERYG